MADYLKVQEHPDLARDTVSGAIVNTNMQAYEAAVNRSRNVKQQKDSMRDAVRDINNLKSEMHEIKSLLLKLVDKE
mgnify:FL=1|jgi:hypothetical protein|tara:strand:- start:1928 stop:2155 length:228 start_codon:yes stop_codon:yes gene_type:complete